MTRQLGKDEKIPYELLLLADETLEAINRYIHDSDIYILEQENHPIAVYALNAINSECIEIKNIAVETKYQGRGIGRFLLQDAAQKAKAMQFKEIIIGTGDSAFRELALYKQEGFEVFGVKEKFFLDNYPAPIYENGIQLKHMIMLKKKLI